VPATRAAAATADSTEMDSTAPAALAPADGRQPGASSGRREAAGIASGQPTPAVTPAAPTAAAHMATATATGGRRGAAAAEVLTPAIAANSTATAVAAEAAAVVEAMAADTKSEPRSGISVLSLLTRLLSTICCYYVLLRSVFFLFFCPISIHTTPNIFVSLSHYLSVIMETWTI
jgi:hypothetical protein